MKPKVTAELPPMMKRVNELLEHGKRYHEHLDKCAQCETRPFDQCPEGKRLLNLAAGMKAGAQ